MKAAKIYWFLFAFFAIAIGIYPFLYFVIDMSGGFLRSKSPELLQSSIWNGFFNVHIVFGGFALLLGWTQFSNKIRKRNLSLHRNFGKVYVASVLLSGLSGLYIAAYSNGGMITHLGFGLLALLWLVTTVKAYTSIRKGAVKEHRQWMIRSFALTFAAVTLRIWLPSMMASGISFDVAYKIVSWLCWVPNVIVAEMIINKKKKVPPKLVVMKSSRSFTESVH